MFIPPIQKDLVQAEAKTLLQAITTHNLFEQKAYEQGFEAGAAFAVRHLNRTLISHDVIREATAAARREALR